MTKIFALNMPTYAVVLIFSRLSGEKKIECFENHESLNLFLGYHRYTSCNMCILTSRHKPSFERTLNNRRSSKEYYCPGPLLYIYWRGQSPPSPCVPPSSPLKGFAPPPSKNPFLSENERKSCPPNTALLQFSFSPGSPFS